MSEKVDVLNREDFISKLEKLVDLLSENGQGCCFGIDGAWGSGKSFILEKFENRIKDVVLEETADNKYFVFHYDCWKYDYYDEPAISIISAMIDETDKEISLLSGEVKKSVKVAWKSTRDVLKTIAGEFCKNKLGIDYVEIASKVLEECDRNEEKEFDSLYGFKRALEAAREGIQKIAESKAVIIVVDELDRCLPTYSIKVLERLHHIFNELNNVIVIVSMDKKQLSHSIQEIYGDIEVDTYLRKFISFKLDLDNGIVNSYKEKYPLYFSRFRITNSEGEEVEKFFSNILKGLDMRAQERIFSKAKMIHTIISGDKELDCSFMTFEILYITLALRTKTKDLKWLAEIRVFSDYDKSMNVSKAYYDMLHYYGIEGIGTPDIDSNCMVKNSMIGRMFFWLANLFDECYNGTCGYLYHRTTKETLEYIEVVHLFKEMIDIIDVD